MYFARSAWTSHPEGTVVHYDPVVKYSLVHFHMEFLTLDKSDKSSFHGVDPEDVESAIVVLQ